MKIKLPSREDVKEVLEEGIVPSLLHHLDVLISYDPYLGDFYIDTRIDAPSTFFMRARDRCIPVFVRTRQFLQDTYGDDGFGESLGHDMPTYIRQVMRVIECYCVGMEEINTGVSE